MRPDDSDAIQPETISSKIEKKLNLEYQTTGISQAAALFYQTHQYFKAFTLNAAHKKIPRREPHRGSYSATFNYVK